MGRGFQARRLKEFSSIADIADGGVLRGGNSGSEGGVLHGGDSGGCKGVKTPGVKKVHE